MNKLPCFLCGLVAGIALTIGVLFVVYQTKSGEGLPGLTMFEERGEIIETDQYSVIQTISSDFALAISVDLDNIEDLGFSAITSMFTPVLLIADADRHFYDGMVVKCTDGRCFYQVGTYQYETKNGDWKTVPALMLLEKR